VNLVNHVYEAAGTVWCAALLPSTPLNNQTLWDQDLASLPAMPLLAATSCRQTKTVQHSSCVHNINLTFCLSAGALLNSMYQGNTQLDVTCSTWPPIPVILNIIGCTGTNGDPAAPATARQTIKYGNTSRDTMCASMSPQPLADRDLPVDGSS
jgi:hypothetical protein